jgi:hypothetical protein
LIYNDREEPEREPLLDKVAHSVQNDARRQEVFAMGKTIAEGLIEKGRKEQEVTSQRRVLVQVLRHKFRKIPAATLKRIEATERLDVLEAWFVQALDAKKLEDVSCATE